MPGKHFTFHDKGIELRPVQDQAEYHRVAELAAKTWWAHYEPIIGSAQVEYMLANLQSPEAIARQIEEGRKYFLIVELSGDTVGYLAYDDLKDHVFLSKIYVLLAYQGKGYGRQAIEAVFSMTGRSTMKLTVNRHNHQTIRFYESLGFVKRGPIVTDIGGGFVMDDWEMVKDVKGVKA